MSLFLNLISLMLIITWAVSYLLLGLGTIAHMILLMGLLVSLGNIIRSRFSIK